MRFSFLATIVALAASIMSVDACQQTSQSCETTSDCCAILDLIFAPCDIRCTVTKSALIATYWTLLIKKWVEAIWS
ncbi:hypothetical protein EV702DRAFT_1073922 [Suillus placidus]|uniref:Uncharacterized protein n=1 Tax=Suillus placidus TaxID=48579 RepID=A0A9P7A285_9AGAM|nr:hypothetical protein EV702DRAFT_1073922 [Suillus placidus]